MSRSSANHNVSTPMDEHVKKIVLTGCPCSYREELLKRLAGHFSGLGYHVALSDNRSSGLPIAYEDALQMMRSMLVEEDNIERTAVISGRPALVLCCGGAMDVRASLSDDMWHRLLAAMDTNVVALRDARYEAVICLSSAGTCIDAWVGHPHLRVVSGAGSLEEQADRVIRLISNIIDDSQPMEIERKYLVEQIDTIPHSNVSDICQTYLQPVDGHERRIRRRGEDGHYVYFLTTKTRLAPDRSIEQECRISEQRYSELMGEANPCKQTIHKLRTCFVWDNQYFELDRFLNPEMSHLMLEIEDAETADAVLMPPFLRVIEDVTGNHAYSNSQIAKIKQ